MSSIVFNEFFKKLIILNVTPSILHKYITNVWKGVK